MKTYWNGEPANCRIVNVQVGKAAKKTFWFSKLEGTVREAIQVKIKGESFLIDNENGEGWLKVTVGRGGPHYGHKSLDGEVIT